MKIISGWRSSNYLARFGIFLIITVLITGMPVSYGVAGDDNQPSQNLEVYTWYDLNAVRDHMRGNHTLMNDLNATTPGYTLLAGPTANGGKGWQPIGYEELEGGGGCQSPPRPYIVYSLDGIFDGQGYEIHDLFINRPGERTVGLFAYLNKNGIIKNVGLVDCNLVANIPVGSLVGENRGTVSNSYSIGRVTGSVWIGGLVGFNAEGTVSNSYSTGNVTGDEQVGGLVGLNMWGSTVSDSYSSASVTGDECVGGLVGRNDGNINNSYATGTVVSPHTVGGLVGITKGGTTSNSFWDTETSGQTTSDGGIGKNNTEMKNITTFSEVDWNIIAVANTTMRDPAYIWNIVNNVTYPFLSWQPVS